MTPEQTIFARPWALWDDWWEMIEGIPTPSSLRCLGTRVYTEAAIAELLARHVGPLAGLAVNRSVHLLREGVPPRYDQGHNKWGGHFTARISGDDGYVMHPEFAFWTLVRATTSGAVFSQPTQIIGVTILRKPAHYVLRLWLRDSSRKSVTSATRETLSALLSQPQERFKFSPHRFIIRQMQQPLPTGSAEAVPLSSPGAPKAQPPFLPSTHQQHQQHQQHLYYNHVRSADLMVAATAPKTMTPNYSNTTMVDTNPNHHHHHHPYHHHHPQGATAAAAPPLPPNSQQQQQHQLNQQQQRSTTASVSLPGAAPAVRHANHHHTARRTISVASTIVSPTCDVLDLQQFSNPPTPPLSCTRADSVGAPVPPRPAANAAAPADAPTLCEVLFYGNTPFTRGRGAETLQTA